MNLARFHADPNKCVGCGQCIHVCPGGLLYLNGSKKVAIREHTTFGWNGCWRCQHCLAVCPIGAVSVLGLRPENSIVQPKSDLASSVFSDMVTTRHSCRRYLDRDVPEETIREMLDLLACIPNGGNKQQVEFTLIDKKEQMDRFRNLAYAKMESLAKKGVYPEGFDADSYDDMKRWEETVRPDMLFCGAPHLLIPHAPLGNGTPMQDVIIAAAYFELLCVSRKLGAVILSFPLDAMKNMPEIWSMLEIPVDHYVGVVIGFGYPEISYVRGVQKKMEESRIHRPAFRKGGGPC